MQTTVALAYVVLLGLVSASRRGPCGCTSNFQFCANDYQTYGSICEFKCKNPSTQFQDWFILYNGPCTSTERPVEPGYEWAPSIRSCYKFHTVVETWFSASIICQEEGGYLAIIKNEEESHILRDLFQNNIHKVTGKYNLFNSIYASVGFRKQDGKWKAIDGKELSFEEWNDKEPNHGEGKYSEECGSILVWNGLLNDVPCYGSHRMPFICERTPRHPLAC